MSTPPGVETRGPAIVGTAIALPIFAALFVGARVYTRKYIINFFGIDDWVSIATLVVSVAYSVCLSIWTYHGGGMHMKDFTPELESDYYEWLLISSEFYALGLLGYKTSILLLYIRLFKVNYRFKTACYIVMALNAAYLLSNIILQIFSCTPVQKFYDKELPGKCVSLIIPDIFWGACSMLSDFAIAILPIPVVWRLKLSKRDKILISLVFLSGLIAFVMATVRWILGTIDLTSEDRTWIAGLTFLFSIVEVNTGIICGCTATLKPLLKIARDAATSSGKSSEKKHRWYHSSSSEEEGKRGDPMRAPPGTMDQSTNKTLDTNSGSESSSDTRLPLSKTTTARPSIADALPDESQFSHDLLNLPMEGVKQPVQPSRHSRHASSSQPSTSLGQPVYELPMQRLTPEPGMRSESPALRSQPQAHELSTRSQIHELSTRQQNALRPQQDLHELGARDEIAPEPQRIVYQLDSKEYLEPHAM